MAPLLIISSSNIYYLLKSSHVKCLTITLFVYVFCGHGSGASFIVKTDCGSLVHRDAEQMVRNGLKSGTFEVK